MTTHNDHGLVNVSDLKASSRNVDHEARTAIEKREKESELERMQREICNEEETL